MVQKRGALPVLHGVVRIVVPAVLDVPQPGLRPEDADAETEDERVVGTAPAEKGDFKN